MEFIFNLFAIIETWKKYINYNLQKTGNELHMWLSEIVHTTKIVTKKQLHFSNQTIISNLQQIRVTYFGQSFDYPSILVYIHVYLPVMSSNHC